MTERLRVLPTNNLEEGIGSQQAGHYLVKCAVSYMQQHYAEKLTLSEVAGACYVSQWHAPEVAGRDVLATGF